MGESAEICDVHEFPVLLQNMVDEASPRLFAVIQELGVRVDGRIAAWGMAFEDHAEVVVVSCGSLLSLGSPQRACQLLSHAPDVTARLVWVGPGPDEG